MQGVVAPLVGVRVESRDHVCLDRELEQEIRHVLLELTEPPVDNGLDRARQQRVVLERERVRVVDDRVLDELIFAAVLYAIPLFQPSLRVWS